MDICHVPSMGPAHSRACLTVLLLSLRPHHGAEVGAAGWRPCAESALQAGTGGLEPLLLGASQDCHDCTPAMSQAQGETLYYLV